MPRLRPGRARDAEGGGVSAATATLSRGAAAAPQRSALAVRLAALAGLAVFVALQWATLVEPTASGRMLLGVLAAWAGAGVILLARRGRPFVIAAVAIVLVPVSLLIAGATAGEIVPAGWRGLISGIGDGISALPELRVPYAGADEFVDLVIVAGGLALVAIALVVAAAAPRRGRPWALAFLIVGYAIPATQTSPDAPYLRGAVFAVLVGAVLWGERVVRPGRPVRGQAPLAIALVGLGAVVGLALGPGLDSRHPWVNWDKLVNELSRGAPEQFAWDHTYGPLDWPRDGRVVLRIKADHSSYWKAANLDGFDGRRWVRAGLRPDNGIAARRGDDVLVRHPRWEETIRVSVAGMRTDQIVGAGSVLSLDRLRLSPLPVGSPGTWAVVGQLHAGDAYTARVYVPRPNPEQLGKAGTNYPDVMELYRTVPLPAPGDDPVRRTEMVFFPFGSTHVPTALGPSGTIAEDGRAVLDDSPYRRTYALARRLATGADTPYEFARRVQAYLNSGRYHYVEDVPRYRVPLDSFLFDDHRGYCQQFSGAMALLLRMGGVPARVSAGFSPGSLDPGRDEYIVRDVDAHSWVEAYFPRYGWVTFDPTPAIAPARAQTAYDPSEAGNPGPAADGGVGDRLSDPKSGGRAPSGPHNASFPVLPLLAGLAAVTVLGFVALAVVRRIRRRRRPALDPRLAELERALRRSGRPAAPGVTLRRLEAMFAGEPEAAAYVRAVREARYGHGNTAPTPGQRRALRRELAAGWGYTGRLRAFWALPPSVW
jgi:protein-glutamine gamma-glutamyltransferase